MDMETGTTTSTLTPAADLDPGDVISLPEYETFWETVTSTGWDPEEGTFCIHTDATSQCSPIELDSNNVYVWLADSAENNE